MNLGEQGRAYGGRGSRGRKGRHVVIIKASTETDLERLLLGEFARTGTVLF